MARAAPLHPESQRLRRTIVREEDILSSVVDDWNRLCATSENTNFFVTPQWILPWWRHFREGSELRLTMYYDDRGPKAMLPLRLDRRRVDGRRVRALELMSNAESPKPQWLIRGDPVPVMDRWLCDLNDSRDWDVLHLRDVPAATPGMDVLPSLIDGHRIRWREKPAEGALILDVTGDFDDYWNSRSKGLRKQFRRFQNKLAARGGFQVSVSRPDDDPQAWLDRVFGIASHTWKTARRTSLADGGRRLFFADVVKDLWSTGQVRIFIGTLGGVDVAYDLTFVYGGFLYGLKTDYHQDYRELAPGIFLLRHLIENGYQAPDIHTIDCITDTGFMRRFTDTVAVNRDVMVFNRTLSGRLVGLLERRLKPLGRRLKSLAGNRAAANSAPA